jgi:hypothetical protein
MSDRPLVGRMPARGGPAALALILALALARPVAAAAIALAPATLDVFVLPATLAPTPASLEIRPDSFEVRGTGVPVTAFVELPAPLAVEDVDVRSIRLCRGVDPCRDGPATVGRAKVGDADGDGVRDLKVTFDRAAVAGLIGGAPAPAEVTLALSGLVGPGHFVGSDTIKVVP